MDQAVPQAYGWSRWVAKRGHAIRTIQNRLGHNDVCTIEIHTLC